MKTGFNAPLTEKWKLIKSVIRYICTGFVLWELKNIYNDIDKQDEKNKLPLTEKWKLIKSVIRNWKVSSITAEVLQVCIAWRPMQLCLDLVLELCTKVLLEGDLPGPVWCPNSLPRLDLVAPMFPLWQKFWRFEIWSRVSFIVD